jgi:hypothetical protein
VEKVYETRCISHRDPGLFFSLFVTKDLTHLRPTGVSGDCAEIKGVTGRQMLLRNLARVCRIFITPDFSPEEEVGSNMFLQRCRLVEEWTIQNDEISRSKPEYGLHSCGFSTCYWDLNG